MAKNWLGCVHVLVFYGRLELISNETGYLAEEISKQSVCGAAWFLLTAEGARGIAEGIVKQKQTRN